VDSLADAWETQRKYGGTKDRQGMAAVAAAAAAAAAAGAPAAAGEGVEKRLTSGAAAASGFVDDGAGAPRFKQFIPGKDGRRQEQQMQQQRVAAEAKLKEQQQQQQQKQEKKNESSGKRTVDVAPVTLVDAASKMQQSAAQVRAECRGCVRRGGMLLHSIAVMTVSEAVVYVCTPARGEMSAARAESPSKCLCQPSCQRYSAQCLCCHSS
jgi:hypothetical protein